MSSHNSNVSAHAHDDSAAHGSLKEYLVGFVLAVVLTVIPFGLAMSGFFPAGVTAVLAAVLAAVQVIVHLRFFLHMGSSPGKLGNLLVFIASVVVIGIAAAGTLWVMHNMNANMMH